MSHHCQSTHTGVILCMRPANERRRYNVTSSFIGWAHTISDPCSHIPVPNSQSPNHLSCAPSPSFLFHLTTHPNTPILWASCFTQSLIFFWAPSYRDIMRFDKSKPSHNITKWRLCSRGHHYPGNIQCDAVITRSNFSKILTKDTPYLINFLPLFLQFRM